LSGIANTDAGGEEGGALVPADGEAMGTTPDACDVSCDDHDGALLQQVEEASSIADAVLGSDSPERDAAAAATDAAAAATDAAAIEASCSSVAVTDGSGPKPEAYVNAVVIDGVNAPSLCGFTTDANVVNVGAIILFPMPGQLPVVPTQDGDFSPGAGVAHIACSVCGAGNSLYVQLSAVVGGLGSFSAYGSVDASGNGSNIVATFTAANYGSFHATNCSISPTYMNMAVPVSGPPVAPGRIFAHLDCPMAVNDSQSGTADDGAVAPKTCDANADFLFENCNQ
jgi:hypothetical protein